MGLLWPYFVVPTWTLTCVYGRVSCHLEGEIIDNKPNTMQKMTIERAREILGDRARFELTHMRRALSSFPMLNSEEENERLEAVKVLLRLK